MRPQRIVLRFRTVTDLTDEEIINAFLDHERLKNDQCYFHWQPREELHDMGTKAAEWAKTNLLTEELQLKVDTILKPLQRLTKPPRPANFERVA
ncbi:hypothetical protein BST61_g4334 [Cercospora zeina]